jgi:hypothetical protein
MLTIAIAFTAACTTDTTAPTSPDEVSIGRAYTMYTQAQCSNGILPETDVQTTICVAAGSQDVLEPGDYQAARAALAWKWGCNFQSGRIWEATDEYGPPLTCDIPNTNPVLHAPSWCDAQAVPEFHDCEMR